MITLEDIRQLTGRELLSRAFVLATRRLEEADADTIFGLITKAMELDARRRPHLWWTPMAPPGQGWCPVCGLPIVRRRRDAIYCSRRCGATARQRRRRERLADPLATLALTYGRKRRPMMARPNMKWRLVTPSLSKWRHTLRPPSHGVLTGPQ
jgi:predicted nucleic acid-binding Zn ribbon protein